MSGLAFGHATCRLLCTALYLAFGHATCSARRCPLLCCTPCRATRCMGELLPRCEVYVTRCMKGEVLMSLPRMYVCVGLQMRTLDGEHGVLKAAGHSRGLPSPLECASLIQACGNLDRCLIIYL